MCSCVFVKVPLGSASNKMMFELSDLHKFMTNKAGASSLDLAFVHKPTCLIENNQFGLLACSIAIPLYSMCFFFYLSEKNEQMILSVLTLFNGALYIAPHCTCTLINGHESATGHLYL